MPAKGTRKRKLKERASLEKNENIGQKMKVLLLKEIFFYRNNSSEKLPVTERVLRASNNGRSSSLKILEDGAEKDVVIAKTSYDLLQLRKSLENARRPLKPKLTWEPTQSVKSSTMKIVPQMVKISEHNKEKSVEESDHRPDSAMQ